MGYFVVAALAMAIGLLLGRFLEKRAHRHELTERASFFVSVPFWVALCATFAFLVLTLTLEMFYSEQPGASFFSPKTLISASKELFFASFIALFIIATIEVISRGEQVELLTKSVGEIRKAVFSAVYGRRIDKRIVDTIEKTILNSDFVREYSERSIVIEPVEENEAYVKLQIEQKFLVRNISSTKRQSSTTIHIPKSLNPFANQAGVSYIAVQAVDGKCEIPGCFPLEMSLDQPIASPVRMKETDSESIYVFPTFALDAGASAEVSMMMTLVKDRSDNEVQTFLSPTLRGSVSVRSAVPDLELNAVSLHRGNLRESVGSSPSSKTWHFEEPILPYQGYTVYWGPRVNPHHDS